MKIDPVEFSNLGLSGYLALWISNIELVLGDKIFTKIYIV